MWSRGQPIRFIFSLLGMDSSSTSSCLRRAEFILDVIGAGATATNEKDWHEIWTKSPKSPLVDKEIDSIVAEGRNATPVSALIGSGFAAPWVYQV